MLTFTGKPGDSATDFHVGAFCNWLVRPRLVSLVRRCWMGPIIVAHLLSSAIHSLCVTLPKALCYVADEPGGLDLVAQSLGQTSQGSAVVVLVD